MVWDTFLAISPEFFSVQFAISWERTFNCPIYPSLDDNGYICTTRILCAYEGVIIDGDRPSGLFRIISNYLIRRRSYSSHLKITYILYIVNVYLLFICVPKYMLSEYLSIRGEVTLVQKKYSFWYVKPPLAVLPAYHYDPLILSMNLCSQGRNRHLISNALLGPCPIYLFSLLLFVAKSYVHRKFFFYYYVLHVLSNLNVALLNNFHQWLRCCLYRKPVLFLTLSHFFFLDYWFILILSVRYRIFEYFFSSSRVVDSSFR